VPEVQGQYKIPHGPWSACFCPGVRSGPRPLRASTAFLRRVKLLTRVGVDWTMKYAAISGASATGCSGRCVYFNCRLMRHIVSISCFI